ncbi:Crp/Fnr family transcriptional regulator [Luedemannella helvata]|uniref:Crp/Fnr family transcriptional regulator n=1 Tax=Luedemannella helvata TaxID=349315 RepID=A0ABN2L763_9ACTN
MRDTPDWPKATFLHELPDEARADLLRRGTLRAYGPGEVLTREGGPERVVYILLGGYVKVLGNTREGRVNLLAIRGAGDPIGEIAAMDDGPRTATVAVVTEARARVLDQATFRAFLAEHPGAETVLQQCVLTKLRQATALRITLGGASVDLRVIRILSYFAVTYGRPSPAGTAIDVPLTQLDIADFIGAGEPSVHRALVRLRQLKLVGTSYRRIDVLDLDGLVRLAEDLDAA